MDENLKKILLFLSKHNDVIIAAILGVAVILTIITAAFGKTVEMSVYLANVNAILLKILIILIILIVIMVFLFGIKVYFHEKQRKNK